MDGSRWQLMEAESRNCPKCTWRSHVSFHNRVASFASLRMPARTWTLEDRLKTIPTIFDQVQNTTANHSKNYVALFKVHQEAAKVTESVNDGEGIRLIGERAFEDVLIDIINRVLVVKKGESVADRVVKFVGGYLKFGNEKGQSNPGESLGILTIL
jgi:hypothetical protein